MKGKHVEAKTIAHTIHNCNNILYSIAKNSQISTCCNLINNKLLNIEYHLIRELEKGENREISRQYSKRNDRLSRIRIKFRPAS